MSKASAIIQVPLAGLLLAGVSLSGSQAGFRSPESLVRNVHAYYGDRSWELSSGLPRDADTARQFFDLSLREASGVDLTFATYQAASSKSECQILNSTRVFNFPVVP